jgi:Putative auto-transporter adhesin, head GIN domain
MKKLLAFSLIGSIVLYSCNFSSNGIKGNGVLKTESRSATGFNGLQVSGSTDVYIKQDSVFSVKVEAEENLLQYIVTETKGNILYIHQEEGTSLSTSKPIKVYLSGPSFNNFGASGACNIYSENKITSADAVTINLTGSSDAKLELKAPAVDADLAGSGTIALKGETKELKIDGSGSTDIKCFDMLSENTSVSLSGSANAEVFASVKLEVHASGSADIKYKGNCAVSQDINGAGSVKKVE